MRNVLSRSLPIFAAIAFILCGCITSEQAKFSRASAVAAFGDGGHYGVYERTDGDHWNRQEAYVLKHRADGAYDFVNEKGEAIAVSFHNLAEGQLIAQVDPEKGKDRFGYVVFRIAANEALVYMPQCDKQDKAKLAAAGVVFRADYECSIDKVADAAALFRTLNLGEPGSKLVRE